MILTRTTKLKRPSAAARLLLLPLASLFIAAGCPLSKATYVLRSSGHDWLRMGPAEDGEVILEFVNKRKRSSSIPLKDVLELGRFERLDAEHRPVGADFDDAPEFIHISGLTKTSGGRNGEWRLAWCAEKVTARAGRPRQLLTGHGRP